MSGSKIHHHRHEEEEEEEKAGTKHTHVLTIHIEVAHFDNLLDTADY